MVMFLLLYFGNSFGVSGNLTTMCSIAGAGKKVEFFSFDWSKRVWNLVFVIGATIGGFIASHYLTLDPGVELTDPTVSALHDLGIENPGEEFVPGSIFNWSSLFTLKGLIILVGGGFLVGFGARYAGGCTSGHAISGISDLQIPSIIAVVGFFIGGLIMTYLLLPMIMNL
jgi:uncharacterized membrane protein YedE/YeeE